MCYRLVAVNDGLEFFWALDEFTHFAWFQKASYSRSESKTLEGFRASEGGEWKFHYGTFVTMCSLHILSYRIVECSFYLIR